MRRREGEGEKERESRGGRGKSSKVDAYISHHTCICMVLQAIKTARGTRKEYKVYRDERDMPVSCHTSQQSIGMCQWRSQHGS